MFTLEYYAQGKGPLEITTHCFFQAEILRHLEIKLQPIITIAYNI